MLSTSFWNEESGSRITESTAFYVINLRNTFGFMWLILSWKEKEK
jgi:hypothetical protein